MNDLKSKVQNDFDFLSVYLNKLGYQLNDLGKHKVANMIAFRLARHFDCQMSDLRKVFRDIFRPDNMDKNTFSS